MKDKIKLPLAIILSIIFILLASSLINDFLTFLIRDKVSGLWFNVIFIVCIWIFIRIFLETQSAKYIWSKLFKQKIK